MSDEPYPKSTEQFKDKSELNEALTELRTLQSLLDLGLPVEDLMDDIEYYSHFLFENLTGKIICASGTVFIPKCDEYGHVIDKCKMSTSVEGRFYSVRCSNLQDEESDEVRQIIRIGLSTGGISFDSLVENSSIGYLAFAPLESSVFIINEDTGPVLPEDDDEIAQEIDVYMLNTPFDLASLAYYVNEKFKTMRSDLERNYYLDYINTLAVFKHVTTISNSEQPTNSGSSERSLDNDTILTSGEFDCFIINELPQPESDDGSTSDYELAIVIWDENNELKDVAVNRILAIELY